MKRHLIFSLLAILLISIVSCKPKSNKQDWVIVIHGGAGTILRENMTPEIEKQYRDKLTEALDTGAAILKQGGEGIDAVEATIHVLENSPLFNAGKGAVFTHDGRNELDASIMSGKDLNAGAVAGVGDVKNPITLARAVMEKSPHVLLSGRGASEFAAQQGIEKVDSSYFYTERRWKSLQKAIAAEKHGTVGCVVLDSKGNLYGGTSTGGMTNKRFGRIGDSPIIGAGTYANNETCAISATGHGEFFIRYTVAHDISALMQYKGLSLEEAANRVIMHKLLDAGGTGGIIGVDHDGNVAMVFNTPGMYRGYKKADGESRVAIYKDE